MLQACAFKKNYCMLENFVPLSPLLCQYASVIAHNKRHGKRQTNKYLRHFLVLWKLIPADRNFNLDNFVQLRQTNSARISRRENFIESVLDICLGVTNSARPARREWLLRQIWQFGLAWQFGLTWQFGSTALLDNFSFRTIFSRNVFQIIPLDCFKNQTIWIHLNELRAITNAIANAGLRVRWNI